jgi:hypothetical protein
MCKTPSWDLSELRIMQPMSSSATPIRTKPPIGMHIRAMPGSTAGKTRIRKLSAARACCRSAGLAAFIGAGGYGERIVTGLALNDRELLLAGALPAAALALLFEGAFALFERSWPRGRGD